ncbi:MAG TPA: LppX_LprAFG lipoprotein [Pseudonocardiaceae bacterium]|jgi:lipoprotein LprG|nr:LppX_LprAFG lipoprotein [Pseudonocardiaceae bacterium]
MSNRRTGVLAVFALVSAVLATLVAGCQNDSAAQPALPAGGPLLTTSAASMAAVTSVHFTLAVNGTLSTVPVQSAQGDLNAKGQAKGDAKLSELGQLIQVDFVLIDGSLYIKGLTGGFQKIPATLAGQLFDPSAILDPDRGVAKVLSSVQNPHTDAQETVDGTTTYRVSGKVAKSVVAALIPGIASDVGTTVWVATDAKHLPVKAEFAVPGQGGAQGATIDVTISNVNAPVSVSAPS